MKGKGQDPTSLLRSVNENADTQVQMNYRMPGIYGISQIPVVVLNLSAMPLVTLLSSST